MARFKYSVIWNAYEEALKGATMSYTEKSLSALAHPTPGLERAMVSMIEGLAEYAFEHEIRFGSKIADDFYLGPAWLESLQAVNSMLNGELGRLDGGGLSSVLHALHERAGFEGEL